MTSRWAYEALAVTQFRDNPFNRDYYDLEREVAQNTFKSIYHTKYLREHLDYCYKNIGSTTIEKELIIIQNELSKQLEIFGSDKLPSIDKVNAKDFNKEVYNETSEFLSAIQKVYNTRRKKAKDQLDQLIEDAVSTPEKEQAYLESKRKYANDRISYMLKNIGTKRRVIVADDELVQKIYPVYARDEHPNHFLDFRTNFYFPENTWRECT